MIFFLYLTVALCWKYFVFSSPSTQLMSLALCLEPAAPLLLMVRICSRTNTRKVYSPVSTRALCSKPSSKLSTNRQYSLSCTPSLFYAIHLLTALLIFFLSRFFARSPATCGIPTGSHEEHSSTLNQDHNFEQSTTKA